MSVPWAIAVILIALTIGHYLLRVNYLFMITGPLVPAARRAARSTEPLAASYQDARTHLADAVGAGAGCASLHRPHARGRN